MTATRSRAGLQVPPHNIDVEESLLGAMLLSRNAIGVAIEQRVAAADFYKPVHGHVFEAALALYTRADPVDPVTVSNELRRTGHLEEAGGLPGLLRLQAQTPASANASHYASVVAELAMMRHLISVGADISAMGYENSAEVTEVLDRAESMVFAVADRRLVHSALLADAAVEQVINRLEMLAEVGTEVSGVRTGLPDLDDVLLGLQPSNLVIVAARPGVGKSTLALGIAANAALREQRPVMMFSLEMSALDLMSRLLAAEARVDARKMQTGRLDERDWARLTEAIGRVAPAPLVIDDDPYCTVMEMRAKARREKAKHGDLGLVVVDYLQLMTPSATGRRAENRQVEVSEISRGLKLLARDLGCPVVALSQLNRAVEYRADKRPLLADLRESGSLEQDADVVILLYRDEMANPESPDRGTIELHVAKHRNGRIATIRAAFVDRLVTVASMANGPGDEAPLSESTFPTYDTTATGSDRFTAMMPGPRPSRPDS